MALPDNNTPWPPPTWGPVKAQIDESKVWYRGTADELAEYYGAALAKSSSSKWRRFWARVKTGQAQDPGVSRRVHVPIAAAIAEAGADLLFGTMPAIDAEGSTDKLAELVDLDGIHLKLLEAAEIAGGVGGVYLRPMWDDDLAGHPILLTTLPDMAIPEYRWGRLSAVTLWSKVDEHAGVILRHVERYEPGVVLHGLYRGDAKRLGVRVGLADHPSTAPFLAGAQGDTGVVDLTEYGITGLGIRYAANVRPNRALLDHPIGRWQGRADTAGQEGEMDALDQTYSALAREVDLAKLRIVVPSEYLKNRGRGEGQWFDVDQEVFSPLNIVGRAEDKLPAPQLIAPELRVRSHLDAAQGWIDVVVAGAGYGSAEIGRDADGGEQTATEVDAKAGISTRTTSKKRGYWKQPVEETLEMMLAIHRGRFDSTVEVVRPSLTWPEPEEDAEDLATRVNLWTLAEAASIETKVRELHPRWSDEDVAEEVDRIREETATTVADPTGGFV